MPAATGEAAKGKSRDRSTEPAPSGSYRRVLDPMVLEQLIGRCAQRDPKALKELCRLIAPTLFGCLLQMLRRRDAAEDALQDVFVRVWQRAGHFDQQRGRAESWLYAIARYRAIDELRRDQPTAVPLEALPMEVEAPDTARADAGLEYAARTATLGRCLELLGAVQRHCVRLAFLKGYSHQQIAEAVASPLGTVKSLVRRGLASLRECLNSTTRS